MARSEPVRGTIVQGRTDRFAQNSFGTALTLPVQGLVLIDFYQASEVPFTAGVRDRVRRPLGRERCPGGCVGVLRHSLIIKGSLPAIMR